MAQKYDFGFLDNAFAPAQPAAEGAAPAHDFSFLDPPKVEPVAQPSYSFDFLDSAMYSSGSPDTPDTALDHIVQYSSDTFTNIMSAFAGTGERLLYLGEQMPSVLPMFSAAKLFDQDDEILSSIKQAREIAGQSAASWRDKLSESYRGDMEAPVIVEDATSLTGYRFGDDWNWNTIVANAVASAPEMMLTAGASVAGAVLGKGALKIGTAGMAKLAEQGSKRAARMLKYVEGSGAMVGGAAAGGAAEGLLAGAAAGVAVEEEVLGRTHGDLLTTSQRYRDIYGAAEGMEETERRDYARTTLAQEAGRSTFIDVGIATGLLGAPMGAVFGKMGARALGKVGADEIAEKAGQTFTGRVTTGVLGEGAQETVQEGSDQLLQNLNLQEYVDPSIDAMEGVINAAVTGGMVGGLLGGGVAAALPPADGAKKKPKAAPPNPEVANRINGLLDELQQQGADPLELMKVMRWAGGFGMRGASGGRSAVEFARALELLASTGRAPEPVEETVGGDFTPDGILSEQAFEKDRRAYTFEVAAVFTPRNDQERAQLLQALQAESAQPYAMGDGSLVVPAAMKGLDALRMFAQTLQTATGSPVTVTQLETDHGNEDQQARGGEAPQQPGAQVPIGAEGAEGAGRDGEAAGRDAEAQAIAGRPAAEGGAGRPLEAGRPASARGYLSDGQGQAATEAPAEAGVRLPAEGGIPGAGAATGGTEAGAQEGAEVAPRAQRVASQLAAEGIAVPVRGDGTTEITPDMDPAAAERAVDIAANDGATSPTNEDREPTDSEKEQGNYRKGRVLFRSTRGNLRVVVENARGSIRRSKKGVRPKWARKMKSQYGYIPGTRAPDGDEVDVYLGRHAHDDTAPVFVVGQLDAKTGAYDEPKVMLGFRTQGEAKDAYLREFPAGLGEKQLGSITELSREEFIAWTKSGDTDVPLNPLSRQPLLSLRTTATVSYGLAAGHTMAEHQAALNELAAKFDATIASNDDGDVEITVRASRSRDVARAVRRLEGAYDVRIEGRAAEADAGTEAGVAGRTEEGAAAGDARPAVVAEPGPGAAVFAAQGTDYAPLIPRPKGTPHYSGKPRREGAVSVVAVHYSPRPGQQALDPKLTGASGGAEMRRFGTGPRTGIGQRKYFYAQTEPDRLPPKEQSVVGTHPYRVQLDNLYDAANDPLGIWEALVAEGSGNQDAFEEAVSALGFDGILTTPQAGMEAPLAIVFGVPGTIPVAPVAEPGPELLAEVGPDPNAEALNAAWSALPFERRREVTNAVLAAVRADLAVLTGASEPVVGVGGYLDGVNPNVRIELPALASHEARLLAAAAVGHAFDQDSTILIEPAGAETVGAVAIDLLGPADPGAIYRHLRDRMGDDIGGFTFYDGGLHILNFSDTPTEQLAERIVAELASFESDIEAEVHVEDVSATFIGRDDYEGYLQGATPEQREAAGRIRQAAQEAVRAAAAEATGAAERNVAPPLYALSRQEVDALLEQMPPIPETIPDNDPIWQRVPKSDNDPFPAPGHTANIDTPEREALRQRIEDAHFAGRIPVLDGQPLAILMGGGGASGKGTLLDVLIAAGAIDPGNAVHVDPDDIKMGAPKRGIPGIPEFWEIADRGDGRAAAVVHKESSSIARRVIDRAIGARFNVILDRTLSDGPEGLAEIARLKEAGYRVVLHGVTVDPTEALRRAVVRGQRTNRWVPFESLLWAHRGFNEAWESYAAAVDEGYLYETGDIVPGQELIAVAKDGDLQTLRQDLYNAVEDRRTYGQDQGSQTAAEEPAGGPEARDAGEDHRAPPQGGARAEAADPDPLAGGEVADPFNALIAEATARREQRRADTARLVAEAGDGGSVNFIKDGGRSALAGPDMSDPGKFRVTRFDEQGPVGHTVYGSMAEAVEDALREGYTPAAAPLMSLAPTFHSALTRAVEQGKGAPKKADAAAWRGWLDGAQRRGEFKGSERQWIGLDDWLAEQGTVTREQLLEFVRANEVAVEETVFGIAVSPTDHAEFERLSAEIRALDNEPRGETSAERRERFRQQLVLIEAREALLPVQTSGEAKYGGWKLPGGENYRELLLTLDRRGKGFNLQHLRNNRLFAEDAFETMEQAEAARKAQDDWENWMVVRHPSETADAAVFRGNHWQKDNVLAHVRFDERTDADGKRVLFLHEIQSDWHQAGRKRGYGKDAPIVAEVRQLLTSTGWAASASESDVRRANDIINRWQRGEIAGYQTTSDLLELGVPPRVTSPIRDLPPGQGGGNSVPDAPLKQTDEWAMLAFKRMVRWAAEHGFDRVAWATGEQAAGLYDLSKRVGSVYYFPETQTLVAMPVGTTIHTGEFRSSAIIDQDGVTPEQVESYVGKEVAERLLSAPTQSTDGMAYHEVAGDGLKIGGEGMRAFYDKIVPAAVGKWAKRFGGAVRSVNLPTELTAVERDEGLDLLAEPRYDIGAMPRDPADRDNPWHESRSPVDWQVLDTENDYAVVDTLPTQQEALAAATRMNNAARKPTMPAHGLDITHAMRAAALQSLPLFRLGAQPGPAIPRAAIEKHVAAIKASWKGRVKVKVLSTISDAPANMLYHIRKDGLEELVEGFFDPNTGTAYLIEGRVRDTATIERVLFEEALGHYGLQAAFGSDLNKLLDDIVRARKDSPEFQRIAADYRAAYAGRGEREFNRAVANELLSKVHPDNEPTLWGMFVAWLREWLRGHGFVREWTDNDILNLMERVHDGVRTGRTPTSLKRLGSLLPDHHPETGESATHGPHYSIRHLRDGEIAISFGDGRELLGASALHEGDTVMAVYGEVTADNIEALARFAAESGALGLQLGEATGDIAALIDEHDAFAGLDEGVARFTPEFVARARAERAPMFSIRHRAFADAATETVLAKAVQPSWNDMTWGGRLQQLVNEARTMATDGWLSLKMGWIDSAAAIEELERQQFGGRLLDAADSAYKFVSFTRNLPNVLAAVMKAGVPVFRNGVFRKGDGRKGLYDILRPLYDTPDGENLAYLWEGYAVARRSKQLIDQKNADGTSKEKLLSRGEIETLLALEKQYPVFAKVFDEWQVFNRQLLDLAVDRGALSAEEAELWKANDYVPFYRADPETDEAMGPRTKRGLSGQKVSSMRLSGSDRRIQPVLENMVLNTAAILDRVYKNEAMSRVIALGESVGMVKPIPLATEAIKVSNDDIAKALDRMGLPALVDMTDEQRAKWTTFFRRVKPVGNNVVSVAVGGKLAFYEVTDPLLFRAIADIGETHFGHLIDFMRGAKNTLTTMVTMDPGFMVANWLRDTLAAWTTSNERFTPLATAVEDARAIWTGSGLAEDLMLAGGTGGGFFDPLDDIRGVMREVAPPRGAIVVRGAKALWRTYRKIGLLSEQVNRMALARAVVERGGSLAEAAWQAQDLLNFSQRGDFTAARLLIRTVPFLNARLQGLYKLYKSALGRDADDPHKARVTFLLRSAVLAAASMALALKNYDDERYEKITDAQKDTYWHIFIGDEHYAIPKPFEIGVLAATIPERIMRAVRGNDSAKTLQQSLSRAFMETFAMNPMPQAFKPLIELTTNYNFYTKRAIVDASLQGLEPEAQYNPWTSEVARVAADLMPDFLPDSFRSPVKIEHAVRAYLGTLGLYMLQMGDAGLRGVGAFPVGPESDMTGIPIIDSPAGRFVRGDPATQSQNKYADDLYEALGRADAAYRTVNAYMKQGRYAEAQALIDERGGLLGLRGALNGYRDVLRELNTRSRLVMMADWMDPAEKRAQLDAINRQRNELLQQARPLLALVE